MPKKAIKARTLENRLMALGDARDNLSEALEGDDEDSRVREAAVDILAVLNTFEDKAAKVKWTRCKIPGDPEKKNTDRAIWAGIAVAHFQDQTGTDDQDALSDMLCDLLHLCDRRAKEPGFDFDKELARAKMHYQAETEGGELTP